MSQNSVLHTLTLMSGLFGLQSAFGVDFVQKRPLFVFEKLVLSGFGLKSGKLLKNVQEIFELWAECSGITNKSPNVYLYL